MLETTDTQASDVDVSINANGDGYAVWQQINGGARDVFASRYSNGVWEPALKVTGANAEAFEPQVAVLPGGEALAIWRQPIAVIGTVSLIFNKTVGGVWQGAQLLENVAGDVASLDLVADAQGNAMAVWSREVAGANPVKSRIFSSYFRNGAFEPEVQRVNLNESNAELPSIAIDAAGTVLVAWKQLDPDDGVDRIHVRYNVNDEWEFETLVSAPDGVVNVSVGEGPKVATGANGVASVVWAREDGSLHMNTSTAFIAENWKGVELVANDGFREQITVDGLGTTTVVFFSEKNGSTKFNSLRKLASGAQLAYSFAVDPTVGFVRLGSDAGGRATAVWNQALDFGFLNAVSSRLDPATGQWGTPELIEREDRGSAEDVSLAVNAEGRAVAAWLQRDGTRVNATNINSISANIFK